MISVFTLLPALALAGTHASVPVKVVSAANHRAAEQPSSQGFEKAVQIYAYAEGTVFQAYTAPGSVTDIALQPGEALVAVASGDTARWLIGDTTSGGGASGEPLRTHILVKPFAAGLSTNLVITTDRRTYYLHLSSTMSTAMAAIRWVYPQDAMLALAHKAKEAEAAAPIAAGLDISQLHFDYRISGDQPGWRPLRVFDDGHQTFIEFPPTLGQGEAPPLFILGPDGKAELVNYRLRNRFYVVDRLFNAAELRLGLGKQQVVRIMRSEASKRGRGA